MSKIDQRDLLACPKCRGSVDVSRNLLMCNVCGRSYPVRNGVPVILMEESINQHGQKAFGERSVKAEIKTHFTMVAESLEKSKMARFVTFLNWGYKATPNVQQHARLDVGEFLLNRNPLKLLFETIGPVDIKGKTVLDVGCGRGGNLSSINRFYNPQMGVGVDLTEASVQFDRIRYPDHNLLFVVGDAERLPLGDNAFEIVINCESSHAYPDIPRFYREVHRVMKAGGYFLYADVLRVDEWNTCESVLPSLGFEITRNQNITESVLASCDDISNTHYSAYANVDDDFMEGMEESLSLPGTSIYNSMKDGSRQFRIVNACKVGTS